MHRAVSMIVCMMLSLPHRAAAGTLSLSWKISMVSHAVGGILNIAACNHGLYGKWANPACFSASILETFWSKGMSYHFSVTIILFPQLVWYIWLPLCTSIHFGNPMPFYKLMTLPDCFDFFSQLNKQQWKILALIATRCLPGLLRKVEVDVE